MCNYSPGDKCRDGRDGNAGPGWLNYPDKRELQLPAVWNDNRLRWFYPLHWSPAVSSNAQKLPHRNSKKVSHGAGTSNQGEQNRTEGGEREQLREAAAVFCPLLATVGEVLQGSIIYDCFTKAKVNSVLLLDVVGQTLRLFLCFVNHKQC